MAHFIVMTPNGESPAKETQFVRDGFSVVAFAVPVIWLIWHRLWLHAALCFAAFGLCAAFIAWNDPVVWIGFSVLTSVCISLLVALEGGDWVKQALERQGFDEQAIISARSTRQAEEYFAGSLLDTVIRMPTKGFAPVSSASLIPLTGNL